MQHTLVGTLALRVWLAFALLVGWRALKESGFRGTVGVLGHIEEEDVRVVLQRNLDGLRKLEQQL